MAINFLNNIASIGTLTITKATTDPLLYLYNTTNGSGATIRFSDQTTPAQVGDITYFHSDGSSQGGGASFHFRSEPDTVVVAGGPSNTGRFVSKSKNDANEVDYGFYDDVNTGMYRTSADNVSLVAGGVRGVSLGTTAVSLRYAGSVKLATTSGGVGVTGSANISATATANQFVSSNNGNGTNYKIGDDVWIGDINVANTFRVQGNQNPNNGYITFGNSSNQALGRAGTGALTWGGAFEATTSVTSPTFLGDLNGTINTATTGTTQTAGNNSTKIATTAYADAAAGAVPIGNYLPLTAGSSYPLTGDLYITKAATPLIQLTDTTNSKTLLLGVDDSNAFIRTGANQNLYLQVSGGTNAITILNNSNVGIGTTNPDTKLHVEGNVLIDAYNQGEDNGLFFREGFLTIDQPSITVWDMSNAGASPDGLSINSNDGIRFRENGGEVARFKDGNFGIGTTSPTAKLHVAGTGLFTGLVSGITPVAAANFVTKAYADAGNARVTPATPSTITSTIVGETIEIAFNQSSTSNIDYYQVWSSDDGGDYGIIAQITPADFSSTMTVVDTTFVTGGTMSYRVFAVREGIYSTAGTTSKAYTVSALSVTDMTVVNLNTAYYIQYEKPTSRFIDHVEIYMDSQTTSAALSRSNATIVYSGQNASYMRNVNTSSNFHQFWVEIVTS